MIIGHLSFFYALNNVYDSSLCVKQELDTRDSTENKIFRELRFYRGPRK